uniref:RNase H type-1 domain-containing protein n=1 Tax=Nicotiana tabacum TaxID=4097 RepID=A0A1S3ZRU9_TOBAC|nr:PREDICTED: uncharacterized protein LOC107789726 [Nicotiana tabacum]
MLGEVRADVFGLNGDSAGGPDGFTGKFYQSCWDIIGDDLFDMVRAFFNGHELPKCVTHTNLVLLPKKKEVCTFSDLRPISLSNFTNKVVSRVIHERLVGLLPNLISEEQAGFVKGRSIVENILLTQEIVIDMRLRIKACPNVVLKLDMTKAYDRLSWLFLTKVLRKMGFSERFIGMVFGIVSNNWYSVLINAAEALSRVLNALHLNLHFCGYGLPKWSPKINHLAYADDTIIFSSSDDTSLRHIMEVLAANEEASVQLVNKAKSVVYLHHLTDSEVVEKVERVTGIKRQEFPIVYLRCPIFYSRRKMEYYQPMITKVLDRLQSWKGKLLSIGGRAILIAHVLQSMPIHLLSAVNPPAYVINTLHKIFAQFFWSSSVTGNNGHWASWSTLCMPQKEGGIGFRSLHDVEKALFCKLWWKYRTKPSLWSSFMSQKYCKKMNSMVVLWRKGSYVWRNMLECRDLVEHLIIWQPRMGSSLFWYDNWTGLRALYFLIPQNFGVDESVRNVWDVVDRGEWNTQRLYEILPEEFAEHIIVNLQPPAAQGVLDVPVWSLESKGQFSVRTAWEYVRNRVEPMSAYKKIWVKGLPFKIVFFMCKVWRNKLPLDEFFRRLGYQMASKCWCCADPLEETTQHLLFTSYVANKVWSITLGMLISSTLQSLIKVRKPGISQVSHRWPDMLKMMEQFTPNLRYTKVNWDFPEQGWVKVNTDGASRGNPGRSSIGFVLRNEEGDVLYACGKEIQEGTNSIAEAKAISEALKFCVQHDYVLIDLHTDSMVLQKVITGEWKPPWVLGSLVEEIMDLMKRANVKISHTLREGNKLADHIANYALDNGLLECYGFEDLDVQGRKLVNSDKLQCTNVAAMFWILRELFMVVLVLCTQPREGNSNPNIATEENQKFLMSLMVFSKSKVTTGALKPRMSNQNGLPDLGYVSNRGAFSGIGSNMGVLGLEGRGLIWGSTAREGVVDTH